MLKAIAALGILLCTTISAQAEEREHFRFGIGLAKYTLDFGDDVKFQPTGFEAFGGYELNRYLSFEAGYLMTGTSSHSFDDVVTIRVEADALFASALASLPLNDAVSLFARAGMLKFERKAGFSGPLVDDGVIGSRDVVKGNDPYYGVGVSADVDGALLRLEYRMAEIEDVDVSVLGLNVAWRF